MVVHSHNPSTEKAEAEEWKVGGQPGLHGDTLFQNKLAFCHLSGIHCLLFFDVCLSIDPV
jgi:hypothetical protein